MLYSHMLYVAVVLKTVLVISATLECLGLVYVLKFTSTEEFGQSCRKSLAQASSGGQFGMQRGFIPASSGAAVHRLFASAGAA